MTMIDNADDHTDHPHAYGYLVPQSLKSRLLNHNLSSSALIPLQYLKSVRCLCNFHIGHTILTSISCREVLLLKMSAEPASKKRRLEDADLHDNIFKAKQKGLWFDDGNIVIVAENTPFLVHKSVLAAKSEIFHDTFSVPQPENDESLNGIPILRLHDTWTDVCKLLTFMYHCER